MFECIFLYNCTKISSVQYQFDVSIHQTIAKQVGLNTREEIVMTLITDPNKAGIVLEFVELSFEGQAMQRPEMWRFQDSQCSKCLCIHQKVKAGDYCCRVNGETIHIAL